jgi:metallophosphoesterase (TIGR00282 family)
MKVLFLGDIVGKGGRGAVQSFLPGLMDEYDCDFCIANGENSAGGSGLTGRCVHEMLDAGIHVITTGDHVWDQRDFVGEMKNFPQVLRPANVSPRQPGRGHAVYDVSGDLKIGVVCLLGRTFMNSSADCPFAAADRIVEELRQQTKNIIVDIHAEATSEKIAIGRHLDGRVSAVLGTHTHVPTADQQLFPGGTAFQCDVGMVGSRESVLGRDIKPVLQRFTTGMPARFTVNNRNIRLHGTVVTIGDDGRARGIQRVIRDMP